MRHGRDDYYMNGEHVAGLVYPEMILQICREYSGLPDVRGMTATHIRFFYEGLRGELRKLTGGK